MKIAFLSALAALAAMVAPAEAADFSATLEPLAPRRALVGALAEISGLAPAGGGRVYAHTDEEARVYELDVRSGDILGAFALGRPAAIGDFEAIAVRGEMIALVTSRGVIYEADVRARRSQSGRSLAFAAIRTGAGRRCEIEGFAPDAGEGYFLACKRAKRQRLVIYRWSRRDGALAKAVDMKLAGAVPNPKDFRAADLVVDEKKGSLLVLDSAGAILEVSLSGERRGYWRLGGDHAQAEGLALLEDGRLLVADEGRIGKGSLGSGKLTLYPPRR